jgi:putative oxidoreductase
MLGQPYKMEHLPMSKEPQTPQMKTYIWQTAFCMVPYVVINVGAMMGIFDQFNAVGNWIVALICGALVGAQIWSVLTLVETSDEYVRAFLVRRLGFAAAVSLALFSTWGFGEVYADAPHIPGFMVFPLFWICFSLSFPILSYRVNDQ